MAYCKLIFKKIVAAKRLKYESNQSSSLAETNKKITDGDQEIELLQSILTKTKIAKKEAKNSLTGKKRQSYKKTKLQFQNYAKRLVYWQYAHINASRYHKDHRNDRTNSYINYWGVEIISLMNLISTPLRKRLSVENLGHCMKIRKFSRSLTENDYQQILTRWLEGAGTKSKSRQIDHRL